MLFSSFEFLFLFLPIFLLVYFVVPSKWRCAVLLAFSLVFYGFGEPVFLPLLVFSAVAHGFFGVLAARGRRGVLFAVVFDLLLLGFFKYYDRIAVLLGLPVLGLSLPLGVSFYSFSALAYVIDCAREGRAEKHSIRFAAYITMFPKLLSGPITRYGSLEDELSAPRVTAAGVERGIYRFVCGFSKKLLLATPANEMWVYLRTLPTDGRGLLGSWLALFFFAFWLYYDFSGYTDMALGLGELLGFSLPENFRYPYCAEGPRDFWKRWHITLSSWFRDYVYIPLGGSRCGVWRTYLNLLVVWLLTGLWHGSTLNFVLWGLYWFVLLALERGLSRLTFLHLPRAFKHLLMIPLILVSWLIFAFEDMGEGALFFRHLFVGAPWSSLSLYELGRNAILLLVLVLGATPLPKRLFEKYAADRAAAPILCILGFLLSLAYLAGGTNQPFLYLKF